MLRLLGSIVLGIAVTFGLFVFMAELIANSGKPPEESTEVPVFDLVVSPKKSSVQTKRRPPPPPPPPKTPPKTPPVEPDPVVDDPAAVDLAPPVIQSSGGSGGFAAPQLGKADGDAQPIVRIEPKYPLKAQRDGITGYVVMSFTIVEDGSTADVKVIEAEPKRVFNREAVRALKKWKYKPRVEEGKAMKQFGLTVRLDFNLDE